MVKQLHNLCASTISKIIDSGRFQEFKFSSTSSLYIERELPNREFIDAAAESGTLQIKNFMVIGTKLFVTPVVVYVYYHCEYYPKYPNNVCGLRATMYDHGLLGECVTSWAKFYEFLVSHYELQALRIIPSMSEVENKSVCVLGTLSRIGCGDIVLIDSNLEWYKL